MKPDPRDAWTQAQYEAGYAFARKYATIYGTIDGILNNLDAIKKSLARAASPAKNSAAVAGQIAGAQNAWNPVFAAFTADYKNDEDSIQKAGSMAGSGGVIVLDEATDVVAATENVSQFYAHESCGQCTPCREGTLWMNKVLHRINTGKGRKADVPLLLDIANQIDGKTICPLGEAAAWPVRALVTKYRSEFEAKCSDGKETT